MKIGMLTTWNTQCGIAEYSRYLVNAMRRAGTDVTVLGSKNYDDRKVAEDETYVFPVFGVLPWNSYGDHSLDVEEIKAQEFDVLHIQYEVLLYHSERLYRLLREFNGIKAITYHDNCLPGDFPYGQFDLRYTHREDVGRGTRYLLPFGIENRRPRVKTFGLGRSRRDIIDNVCTKLGYDFSFNFGEQTWQSTEDLTNWLTDSDAIVLYYDDVPSAGSSQAARTAIGTRRPVIVNDVTWFQGVEGAHFVSNEQELEEMLKKILHKPVIEAYSWDNIAAGLLEDYENAYQYRHPNV